MVSFFKQTQYVAEFLVIWTLDAIVTALPRSWALSCGQILGWVASLVLVSRKNLLLRNVAACFPEMSQAKRLHLNRSVWKNLGMTAVEFARLSRINDKNYTEYFEYEGVEEAMRGASLQSGIIFVTLHVGNWEMSGIGHQFRFKNLVAIAKPIKNPWVERFVRAKRSACGLQIVPHRNAVRASLKALKAGKSVGILMDQNIRQGGVFVDFLGRPAATTTLPALLHIRTGAPVIVGCTVRQAEKFKLIYLPVIKFPEAVEPGERVYIYTQILSDAIGAMVRQQPENWFWLHNRWKRAPDEGQHQGIER